MAEGLYLYGIFPPPGPKSIQAQGLDKQPIYSHTVEGFTFLYSEAQQSRYLASRRNLITHTKVLEEAMEKGQRTLLPLQFGLIVPDWETVVQDLLSHQGETLQNLFKKLEGKREVSLKIYWETEVELNSLLDENPSLKARRDNLEGKNLSMDEVIGIGQALEQAMEARKQEVIAHFEEALFPFAFEVRHNDVLTETMIYNTAFLISWESEPEFGKKVEAVDAQFAPRLKIRYNNFTPPYNFVEL
ncbi:MAG: GvpL/GvpF family gas vesicle protein [Halothece sp.]